MKLQNWKKYYL